MKILTVNAGSSAVRLALFETQKGRPVSIAKEKVLSDKKDKHVMLKNFLSRNAAGDVSVVTHRIVHGGARFRKPCIIGSHTEEEIKKLAPLAPLHNPLAIKWVEICRDMLEAEIKQIAVFDTAFFSTLPEKSASYGLPVELCRDHGIRRYGFHGLAHKSMLKRWQHLRPEIKKGGKVISFQLGSGSSAAAINEGVPIDTSMGFSPLEGLVMSTRPGDLDPGIMLYLTRNAGYSPERLDEILNRESGLLGISEISGDMKELLSSKKPSAEAAVELYCYRAKKYLGAYIAALGGVDAVLFGGGIGENAPLIREEILSEMQWSGIELDQSLNNAAVGKEAIISALSAKTAVAVIKVDEAALLAEEALDFLMNN
jgi:acetate kinase